MPATEQNVLESSEVVLALRLPPPCAAAEGNKEKAEEFPDRNSCRVKALLKQFEALWVIFASVTQRYVPSA